MGTRSCAIDDNSRVSFGQIHPDEKLASALAFLYATVAHDQALGVLIKRLITDNGPAYRSRLFARALESSTPSRDTIGLNNGEVERFIQTCLREWAYGRAPVGP